MKKITDIALAVTFLVGAFVTFYFAVPALWKHGSSVAFEFAIVCALTGVYFIVMALYILSVVIKEYHAKRQEQ